MPFAEKLKTLRIENEMTQDYVAKRLNVARSTIAGYETKNRQPSHEKLTAIAGLFHVSVDYLLDDEPVQLVSSQTTILSANEKALLSRYHHLSARSKRDLLEYIKLLELRDHSDDL